VKYGTGREILVEIDRGTALGQLLVEHTEDAHFSCTVDPSSFVENRWIPLAKNKYGSTVAGIIAPREPNEGVVFIFPQLRDKPRFLVALFNDMLPDFAPRLFPHAEGANWVHQPEYEIPEVLNLQQEIKRIEEETKQTIATLEQSIYQEQTSASYKYDIVVVGAMMQV